MRGRSVCLFFCCMSAACERRGAASDNASAEPVTQLREIGVLREPDGIPYEADPAGGAITHDGSVAFAETMSFVVQSRISPTTLAFNTWEFERNSGLRLVGRFKNGEWVAR